MAARKLINRTGPAWTKKEANVFYGEFMKKGTDWPAIVQSLGPSRTEAMVRALHSRHRGYLMRSRTSAAEFVQQVMQAQQSESGGRKRGRPPNEPSFSSSLGFEEEDAGVEALTEFAQALRRPPCKQLDFDAQTSGTTTGTKRKWARRNGAGSSNNISGTSSGSSEQQHMGRDSSEEDEDGVSMTKNPHSRISNYPYMSIDVRKLHPVGAPPLLGGAQEYDKLQQEFSHCLSSKHFRQFAIYEWFYSVIDKLYFFQQSEFKECLYQHGFGKVSKLTRKEWCFVRNVIGKPRRLSKKFLIEERTRLEKFRANVRKFQEASNILPPRLLEGQRVTAIHPQSFELHLGTVIGVAHIQSPSSSAPILHYRVKFERTDDLPALVPDSDIMPQGALTRWSGVLDFEPAMNEWTQHPPSTQEDFSLIGSVLKQLDQKKALLDFLQYMNRTAQEMKEVALRYDKQRNGEMSSSCQNHSGSSSSGSSSYGDSESGGNSSSSASNNNGGSGGGDKFEFPFQFPFQFRQQYAAAMLRLEKVSAELEQSLAELRARNGSGNSDNNFSTAIATSEEKGTRLVMHENTNLPILHETMSSSMNTLNNNSNNNNYSNSNSVDPMLPFYSSFFGDQTATNNKGSAPFPSFSTWPSGFPLPPPPLPPSSNTSNSSLSALDLSSASFPWSAWSSSCPSSASSLSSSSASFPLTSFPLASFASSSSSSSSSSFSSSSSSSSMFSSSLSSSSSLPFLSDSSSFSSSSSLLPSPCLTASFSSDSSSAPGSFFPSSTSFPLASFPEMDGSDAATALLGSLAYSYPPQPSSYPPQSSSSGAGMTSSLHKAPSFIYASNPQLPSSSSSTSLPWLPPSLLPSFPPQLPYPPSPLRHPPDSPRLPTPHPLPTNRFPSNFSSSVLRLAASASDPLKNVRYEKEVFVENILETLIRERQIGRHSSLHTDTNAGIAILRLIVSCISLIHMLRLGPPFTGVSAALAALNHAPQNQKEFESIVKNCEAAQRTFSR